MRFSAVFAGLLALASVAGAARADSIVSNPNFTYTNYSFPGYAANGTQISGWTGTGTYGATGFNLNGFWNNGSLPAGDASVGFIQTSGSLSTTLNNLKVGQVYELDFLDNSRSFDGDSCCNALPYVSVSVGGSSLLSALADPSVGGTNSFHSISKFFTANSTSETLTFSAATNGAADGTALFSDVSVSAVTPEPASLALLGTGLVAGMGVLRRRRLA